MATTTVLVTQLTGQAWVRDADGNLTPLREGMRIPADANVVTAWHAVAEWDGRKPLRLNARIEGEDPAVVIVQSARPGKSVPLPGPIVAARKLQ